VVGSRGSVIPFFKKLLDQGVRELPVTDERMTRFWITLQDGVDFVIKNFERMQGGEIFVPKIPSATVLALAKTMAPDLPPKIVGIRPGEKLHEIMCPSDDCHLTLEFHDHFVIKPSVVLTNRTDYAVNSIGEAGLPVTDGFEYNSGTNPNMLDAEGLRALVAVGAACNG
jgi:UDP-N-acetylglucosamine 4,6-dehydratase